MIDDDEELAVLRKQLNLVEEIVESWRKKLLPDHPKNFALYAEGAIEQADKLRAEIDAYLAQKKATVPVPAPASNPAEHPSAKTS